LKKISNTPVEGDGFTLEILNQYSAKYSEEEKFIELSVEPVGVKAKYDTVVLFSKPKWGEIFSVDYLDEDEKSRVKERLINSLKVLGRNPVFDEGKGFDVGEIPKKKYQDDTTNSQKILQGVIIVLFLIGILYLVSLLF